MRLAIDTGGTFTDCVYSEAGSLKVLKVASTPADPGEAVLTGVKAVAPQGPLELRHGTTVGTNTLLERKGARVAFVTTEGFEDTIAIGRQARGSLYDWSWTPEPPLAPADLRFGVRERTAADGTILLAVSPAESARLKEQLAAARPESIALSFLFGFVNPANEEAAAAALRELGVPVSVAHEILPEFREYERGATVLINAYLAPRMQGYLDKLASALEKRRATFHVMQSSGGIIAAAGAAREPVRTILSGPAGGVVGALTVARAAGWNRILTFDMGGTSTDVALMEGDGALRTTKESQILGLPVAVPTLHIHTVGAGGGSLASFDSGGALRVGPESAGADPGPVCYGRGERPTVTDANLLLGRLATSGLLGGGMVLDRARARDYFEQRKATLATIEAFAEGIVRVADSLMEKALRRISIEQGYDPREFVLLSFGGAGPLHACALAKALRIRRVLVPNLPGALSAYGILVSDFVRDYSRTVMLHPGDPSLEEHFRALEQTGQSEMSREGLTGASLRSLDMRYQGQGFELQVPWREGVAEEFHGLHDKLYGYADRARPVEIVNVRVRLASQSETIAAGAAQPDAGNSDRARVSEQPVYVDGRWLAGRVYDRSRLAQGDRIAGPAVIAEYSATTFLPPDATATVDAGANLLVEIAT